MKLYIALFFLVAFYDVCDFLRKALNQEGDTLPVGIGARYALWAVRK